MSSPKFLGLLTRRERWGLSWRGWVVVIAVGLLASLVFVRNVQSFLAVTHRVPAKILVVEGWVHGYGVDAAVREFKTGHYQRILNTGGPVEGIGLTSSVYDTYAHQTAELLVKAGIPPEDIQEAPATYVGKDRTYTSAIALRNWFRKNGLQVNGINVLTESDHARRTWLLFQEAMGRDMRVGIISVPNPDYDANHWWRTSEGVRDVIDEGIAYVYAKFFFWPSSL
jgi:hypothetical protein